MDESYFGEIRKGKRGRGSAGKIRVFGLLKCGGKVYTKVISNAKSETLIPIIEDKVIPDSIVYSDSFKSYNVLDISEFKHYRINHSKHFAKTQNHINGIENFWNQAKRHMRKFNGVPKEHFEFKIKNSERYNIIAKQNQPLAMPRTMLTEKLWLTLKLILLDLNIYDKPNLRNIFEGILFRVRTGCPWRDIPSYFGASNTIFKAFSRWSKNNKLMVQRMMLK